ncbi:MAG: divalent-cation tolerance protein CutA [Methanomassiliicoccales archaeon]
MESAKKISKQLVENRLVACANLYPIESIYRWENEIEEGQEFAVLLKARVEDFPLIEKFVKKNHPYKIPCIVMYSIDDGFPPYLEWIKESTNRNQED